VECHDTAVGPPYVNVLGGVISTDHAVDALQKMVIPSYRHNYDQKAQSTACEDRFRWSRIAKQFAAVVDGVVG